MAAPTQKGQEALRNSSRFHSWLWGRGLVCVAHIGEGESFLWPAWSGREAEGRRAEGGEGEACPGSFGSESSSALCHTLGYCFLCPSIINIGSLIVTSDILK
jgi:hypothetical protein